jgi:hypothetical protein
LAPRHSTALLICGALAKEVIALRERHDWAVDIWAIPAKLHMTPARIAPAVHARFEELRADYEHILIVYGDCGTAGALDALLDELAIERIAGPHCYEMYASDQNWEELMAEESGTFFLTDYLVRQFDALVMKGLGLDRYPFLRDDYFRNYKRMVYLAQSPTDDLREQAKAASKALDLPLEVRETGYGDLETRIADWLEVQSTPRYDSLPPPGFPARHLP